jgi:hypothetical protein
LKHIRNSFAHGFIESRGNEFYFLDVPKKYNDKKNMEEHATMLGTMDKKLFYEMINDLLDGNSELTSLS